MSATSIRRLRKEWSDINLEIEESKKNGDSGNSKSDQMKVELVGENITHWSVNLPGPTQSPFENGTFHLDIQFPTDYPFKPPVIKFVTKVYHPNISMHGAICLDILKDQWSPALSVYKVLLSISSLLADPNPNDPLSADVATVYKNDRERYNKTVKDWVVKYATTSSK